jgi:two-component system response regulator PilR (NtrC family)
MPNILVVDDEKSIQEFFEILLKKEGLQATCVGSGAAALEQLKKNIFDLVISDVSMPGMTGIELLTQVKAFSPETSVVMITAFGAAETAVEAMKQGATDYLLKPFKVDEIKIVIRQILERASLSRENTLLKEQIKMRMGGGTFIGRSPQMLAIFDMVQRLAKNRSNVLISGASGTGKELVARAIHEQGERKNAPFVSINCGAIPENLIESELFGYMRGAFTGAGANKRGLMEVAEHGTFFLDEIGELPLATQVKLLRVLQERKIRRVGGIDDITIDCRIIAATNRELAKEVERGNFREDLYYRLNVLTIKMPLLKERRDDIPILLENFINKYAREHERRNIHFSAAALECFKNYSYPGNVRELENLVEQTVALSSKENIDVEDLPAVLRQHPIAAQASISTLDSLKVNECDIDQELANLERKLILSALQSCGGVKKKAAKLLKISFRSMRYRLNKLNIATDDIVDENEPEESSESEGQ